MTRLANSVVIIPFLMLLVFMPCTAQAKVDWEVSSAVQLDEIPIDVLVEVGWFDSC